MNGRGLIGAVLLAIPSPATHAYSCGLDVSIDQCYGLHIREAEQRVHDRAKVPDQGKRKRAVDDRVKGLVAGSQLGGLATSLLNTLPTTGLLGLAGDSDQANAPNLGLALDSNGIGIGNERADTMLQPAAVVHPQVFPPLKSKLDEAGAADRLRALEEGLDLTDALQLGLTVAIVDSVMGFQFGRVSDEYSHLFDMLVIGSLEPRRAAPGIWSTAAAQATVKCAWAAVPTIGTGLDTIQRTHGAGCVDALNASFAEEANKFESSWAAAVERYHDAQLHNYANLVSNQGQLYITAQHLEADAFVSPRVSSARITLEIALDPTMADFLEGKDHPCRSSATATACYNKYVEWMDKAERRVSHNMRVATFLEVARVAALDVSVDPLAAAGAADGIGIIGGVSDDIDEIIDGDGSVGTVDLHVPGVTRVKVGAHAGRSLFNTARGLTESFGLRLEAGADYTWFDVQEAVYNERYRIYGGLVLKLLGISIPLQGVYVSDSEFDIGDPVEHVNILGGARLDFF